MLRQPQMSLPKVCYKVVAFVTYKIKYYQINIVKPVYFYRTMPNGSGFNILLSIFKLALLANLKQSIISYVKYYK